MRLARVASPLKAPRASGQARPGCSAAGTRAGRSGVRRMQEDFGEAVLSPVELLVGAGRLGERQLVRHQLRGCRPARDDQVAELLVVPLDRALSGAHSLPLLEERAVVEADPALLRG